MKTFFAYEENWKKDIEKYLRKLTDTDRKPFNCPKLIALSEDVHIGGFN